MSGERRSNWRAAVAAIREGFLLTTPYMFSWQPDGPYYVDSVPVSERVYELAYAGKLAAARTLWLQEFDGSEILPPARTA